MALLDSTKFYHIGLLGSTWPYLTSLYSTMALMGSTWLYYTLYHGSIFTLPHSNMALLHYFIESTIYTLPGSTWLCLTLLHSSMDLLAGSTSWLYYTLPCMALLGCTWVDYTLPWLYLALYFTLLAHYHAHSTMALLGFTWVYRLVYYTLPWLRANTSCTAQNWQSFYSYLFCLMLIHTHAKVSCSQNVSSRVWL